MSVLQTVQLMAIRELLTIVVIVVGGVWSVAKGLPALLTLACERVRRERRLSDLAEHYDDLRQLVEQELRPNSGDSMKDQLTAIEQRLDQGSDEFAEIRADARRTRQGRPRNHGMAHGARRAAGGRGPRRRRLIARTSRS